MSGSTFNSAAWRRRVIATPKTALSPSQKLVLLMLETFADYRDGTNAHPGIQVLAEMCGLTPNAIGTALGRGRDLGLIERTEPANRGGGKSDVYRLVLTPTAVGVSRLLTPTAVGVNGTDYPNGHDPITPTATTELPQRPLVPPTHDQLSTKGGSPQPGTSPGADVNDPPPAFEQSANGNGCADLTPADDAEPPRFCPEHPTGTRENCRPCGDHRRRHDAWQATQHDRSRVERQTRRDAIGDCPDCDEFGQVDLGEAVANCQHPKLSPATGDDAAIADEESA